MATENRAAIVLSATDKTAAAFASAKRNMLGLQSSAAGINASLASVRGGLLGIAAAAILVSFKNITNGIDALNDLKDSTGASIENISALEDVAARTGTSFDTVGTALVKFNAQLKEAKPGSGPAEVLKAIGLEAENLKRLDPAEALRQTAVALSAYADDGNKARIAQELFGKSIKEVAPFLNDLAKQGQLNATVTTAQAEAAEKLNQQISAFEKNIKDASRALVGELIPALNKFFEALNQGGGISGIFAQIDRELKAKFDSAALRKVTDDIVAVQTQINEFGPSPARLRVLDQLTAQYEALRKKTTEASDAMKKFAPPPAEFSNEGRNRPRPSAPDVPGKADTAGIDKARAEALANLRKVIEGRVKTIAEGLENERDLQRFHEDFSRNLYAAGQQSLEQFYAAQDQARQDNLAAVRKATDAEIAERQKLLSSKLLKTPGERQEVENQIEEARAKLRAAEREADQAARLGVFERNRATEALRDDVAALDAQIRELAGDASAGNLLTIARQAAEAKRLLTQAGVDPAEAEGRVQQLRTLLTVQQQFNAARNNLAGINDAAAVTEERLLLASERNGAGLLQTEQAIANLRRDAVSAIEAEIAAMAELLALNPSDSNLITGLRDAQLQLERLQANMDPTKLRLDAAAGNIGDTLAEGFGRALKNVRDIKSILADVGSQVFDIVNREIIVKPLAASLSNVLKGAGGQGTGENILTSIFGIGKQGAGAAATMPGSDGIAGAIKSITGLGTAAGGSADVLGKLPSLAVIPATTAMGTLASAAQIATTALLQMAATASAGAAGSSGAGLLGLGGLIGGGGGFGSGANFGNLDLGLFLHQGGIAGQDGSVTRYHTGGIAGQLPNLQADEVPAILRRGEEVLTRTDPRHRANGGTQQVSINAPVTVMVSGQVDRRTVDQIAAAAGTAVRRAAARGTAAAA